MLDCPNFWSGTHPLSAKQTALFEELIPSIGTCETIEGEMLRAASRIHYDLFNNGWGCNNWSGAVMYLATYAPTYAPSLDLNLLNKVHEYSHGEPSPAKSLSEKYYKIVTDIVEAIVTDISETRTPNDVDMFDLQEDDYQEEEYYEDEGGYEDDE